MFHQSKDDEIAERAFVERLLSRLPGRQAFYTWKSCEVDAFICSQGVLRTVIEVKCRPNVLQHDTYKIDVAKIEAIKQFADFYGVPGLLYVHDKDNDWTGSIPIPLCEVAYQDKVGRWGIDPYWGREGRDVYGPAYEIPWDEFRLVRL